MNYDTLKQLQAESEQRLKTAGADALDPVRRAEMVADARERRMLTIVNDAVFWGVLKAHLAIAVLGGLVWFMLVGRHTL